MTREEAIKILDEWAWMTSKPSSGGTVVFFDTTAEGMEDVLDMAIAALREQPRWISVEERLPERRGHYFISYKFADLDMRFYGEAMWHDDVPDNGYVQGNHFANEGLHGMRVTHWMEIPEPPEVEG